VDLDLQLVLLFLVQHDLVHPGLQLLLLFLAQHDLVHPGLQFVSFSALTFDSALTFEIVVVLASLTGLAA